MESEQSPLKNIPIVKLSQEGIFKYILINASIKHKGLNENLIFVRGSDKRQYHAENFHDFIKQLEKDGFRIVDKNVDKGTFSVEKGECRAKFTCPGGGRIEHNYKGKKCNIYGYSKSYGRVDHNIAKALISEWLKYPESEITTSQQGY